MLRLDNQFIPKDINEVRLFVVGKNEAPRLPHFIQYYKKLGIDRIFYIDNNSEDNSKKFILQQPNVHLWLQKEKYSDKNKRGVMWREELLRQYGQNQWCLMADVDEYFVYIDQENKSIKEFIKELDFRKVDCVEALLIDMYSDKLLKNTILKFGQSPFEICPYFDKRLPGMRGRIFKKYWNHWGKSITKIPIVKYKPTMNISAGFHVISGIQKKTIISSWILHFKFISTLPQRLNFYVKEKKAAVYKNFINNDKNTYFFSKNISIKYKNSQQLMNLKQEDEYLFPYHWLSELNNYYNINRIQNGYWKICLDHLLSNNYQRNINILDAGCGDGRFTKMIINNNFTNIYGVDFSKRALKFAELLVPDAKFINADITQKLPYKDNFFDIIFLIETLEHFPPQKINSALYEIKRVMKSDGRLIITVPSNKLEIISKHYQHFSEQSLAAYLKPIFKIKQIIGQDRHGIERLIFKILDNSLWQLKIGVKFYEKKIYPRFFNQCAPKKANRFIAFCENYTNKSTLTN